MSAAVNTLPGEYYATDAIRQNVNGARLNDASEHNGGRLRAGGYEAIPTGLRWNQ